MTIVWILFVCSVVLLPTTALLALRWALRHGEFRNLSGIALSIFDDDEPVGQQTDFFPGRRPTPQPAPAPGSPDRQDSHPASPSA
jgi:nitrogen fixation-related uncharacterized protein